MDIKTKLRTALYAGEVLVAESEDPELWHRTLSTVTGVSAPVKQKDSANGGVESTAASYSTPDDTKSDDPVRKFAASLGIKPEMVVGACDPSTSEPYLHLDHHTWEAFRDNHPVRGTNAVSPAALSATLLTLWFKAADMGEPTMSLVNTVLGTIGIRDKNPTRGVKNCEWVQDRSGRLVLNPAKISKAEAVARAFCTQQALDD